MEMPPTSMYGDHRAALDTLAAHHAAAQQHMNHSSRHNTIAFPVPVNSSLSELIGDIGLKSAN